MKLIKSDFAMTDEDLLDELDELNDRVHGLGTHLSSDAEREQWNKACQAITALEGMINRRPQAGHHR
jgi:hypothetical protein